MTLPFDHAHDLDLGISRSEFEIDLYQERDGRLACDETNVSHPFMTMILTIVNMVGWVDVPDSDRGDFRRWRAVDISSYISIVKYIGFIPKCQRCVFVIRHYKISNLWPEKFSEIEFVFQNDTCLNVRDRDLLHCMLSIRQNDQCVHQRCYYIILCRSNLNWLLTLAVCWNGERHVSEMGRHDYNTSIVSHIYSIPSHFIWEEDILDFLLWSHSFVIEVPRMAD